MFFALFRDGEGCKSYIVGCEESCAAAIIDPALVRSGRLSPHMKISLPDVTARMGILRHHLGKDLDSIVATAPKPTVLASEDDLRAFLHTLPDAVLRDLAGKGLEDIAWKGMP